ncbi:MAG: superfamily II DNA or RNA helicase [Myxococcota bacterium]|jgi:superfamily II DNA or RNA helicase
MGFKLRPYQNDTIASVLAARRGGMRRMVVSLPTGSGKTVIFSRLAAMANRQVLVLAHRSELLSQARDKLQRTLAEQGRPDALVEIEQAGSHASAEAAVVVASLRTLHADRLDRLKQDRDFGLIIYDECHHAPAEDNLRILRQLGVFDADWDGMLIGFTATTMRADGKGLDEVFEDIVYSRTLPEMISDGYLVPLRGFRIATHADLTHIGGGGADLNAEELEQAVNIEDRNTLVARSIQELARDRRTIVFCVTVAHARNLARALSALGVRAGLVHGEMKSDDRQRVLAMFAASELQVITNVGVLTEGFDDPGVACVAMARPTKSVSLYTQMVGRGMRLAPDKEDCLVLDFVDVSSMSLVTLPSLMGLPRELDLEGKEVGEALAYFKDLSFDFPGFEIEAGEISLTNIKERSEQFDPLTLHIDPNIVAITPNEWWSLGSAGLALFFFQKRDHFSQFLVLDRGQGADRYHILLDRQKVAAFSTLQEAVSATDYEVQRMGRFAQNSAQGIAPWRFEPITRGLAQQLSRLRPPRRADSVGEAMRYLVYDKWSRKKRWGSRK